VFNTLALVSRGVFPPELGPRTEATYLAGIFRSVRFGAEEAHGKANLIQFNFLRRAGAFTLDPATGRFGVDRAKFAGAIRDLAARLLAVEAEGDDEAARRLIADLGGMPAEMKTAFAGLHGIPVDIRPRYTLGEKLLRE
jgi:hypothetical protein